MNLTVSSKSYRFVSALAITALLGSAAQADMFNLPPDYWNRFGSIEGAFDTKAGTYGVRYFPLPIKTDLRIIFVNHASYNEYGVYTRYKDTDIKLANLDGGQKGIMTAEMNHNPWNGIQFHSKFQWSGVKDEYFANYVEGGYAKALPVPGVDGLNLRLFGAVGYGALKDNAQPFTHVEAWMGKDFPGLIKNDATKTNITLNASGVVRNYYFFTDKKAFTTLEANVGIRGDLTDRLHGYARHLERTDFGKPENNVYGIADGKARESFAGLQYRLDYAFGPANLHTVQYDYAHYWYDAASTSNRNELGATLRLNVSEPMRLDVTPAYDFYWRGPSIKAAAMFRAPEATNAVGPSVKYTWLPNNNHRWSVGFEVTDKGN